MENDYFEPDINEIAKPKPNLSVWVIPISIIIAGVMIAWAVYWTGRNGGTQLSRQGKSAAASSNNTQSLPPLGDRDAVLGNPKAPVIFIEYGDYQCPFCGRFFHQVEPQLRDEYIKTGKVKMVFRNFQILGQESTAAAAASECAKDQGKFWAYHDELYKAETADNKENSGNLNRDLFLMLGQNAGLDMTVFVSCLDSNKYIELVKKEMSDGQAVGLTGTPTSYINGEQVEGAQPYSVFKNVIDIALQRK